jgi:hypothetical protein
MKKINSRTLIIVLLLLLMALLIPTVLAKETQYGPPEPVRFAHPARGFAHQRVRLR